MIVTSIKKYIPEPIKKPLRAGRLRLRIGIHRLDSARHPSEAIYYCPCCNVRLRRFVSGGFDNKPDVNNPDIYRTFVQEVVCPVCDSLPRHRILAMWLANNPSVLEGRILYFAPENGMISWMKRHGINMITADLLRPADLQLDIEDTGMPGETWDLVICNHVLEHVSDYRRALREIWRILKPGGVLICSFPILSGLPELIEETEHTEENINRRIELYGQADHLRIFGNDSREMLENAGFSVSHIDGKTMPGYIMPVMGPADYDVNYLFVCKKVLRHK